jgi:DNA-binding NarL/FixJ family response regulator
MNVTTSHSSVSQATVAIVDDHELFTQALGVRLGQEPDLRVVATTASASRVLDVVAEHHPDVLVLDVELDTMNGLDLCAEILTCPIPPVIVILTFRDDNETAARALRAGASAVVLKLGPIQDVIVAIRSALRGEAWLSPTLLRGLVSELRSGPGEVDRDGIRGLSTREIEILALMVEGKRYAEIANHLALSVNTVRTHAHNLQKKLGVNSRVAAIALGLRAGLRPEKGPDTRW